MLSSEEPRNVQSTVGLTDVHMQLFLLFLQNET